MAHWRSWVTGPEIELIVAAPAGPSVEAVGIVDTGASVMCMDRRIALHLGLAAVNRKQMQLADGAMVPATGFVARLVIPALGVDDEFEVFGVPMQAPTNRVLIGRSFLRRYIVNYNGPAERFEFHEINNRTPDAYDD